MSVGGDELGVGIGHIGRHVLVVAAALKRERPRAAHGGQRLGFAVGSLGSCHVALSGYRQGSILKGQTAVRGEEEVEAGQIQRELLPVGNGEGRLVAHAADELDGAVIRGRCEGARERGIARRSGLGHPGAPVVAHGEIARRVVVGVGTLQGSRDGIERGGAHVVLHEDALGYCGGQRRDVGVLQVAHDAPGEARAGDGCGRIGVPAYGARVVERADDAAGAAAALHGGAVGAAGHRDGRAGGVGWGGAVVAGPSHDATDAVGTGVTRGNRPGIDTTAHSAVVLLLADDAADRVARTGNGAAVLAIRHEGRAEAGDAADAVGAGDAPAVMASRDGHAARGCGVVGGAYDTAGVAHAARGGDRGAVLAVLDGAG